MQKTSLFFLLYLLAGAFHVECNANRSRIVNGVKISYPRGEKAFVEKIVEDTDFPILVFENSEQTTALAENRDKYLSLLADLLALEEPSDLMFKIYNLLVEIDLETNLQIEKISIYQLEDIAKWQVKGRSIPGIEYDPIKKKLSLNSQIGVSVNVSDEDVNEYDFTINKPEIVVVLDRKLRLSIQSRMDYFNWALENQRSIISDLVDELQFTLLHEAIEAEIVTSIIKSSDRRWFADGMANAIAALVLSDRNRGYSLQETLDKYYPPPENIHEVVESIDLEKWPAAENETGEEFVDENYYLASQAIIEMIEDEGKDVLEKLFSELRGKNLETNNMKTVYQLFEQITGTDLRTYIGEAKHTIASGAQHH